jgi:hypothetical protein
MLELSIKDEKGVEWEGEYELKRNGSGEVMEVLQKGGQRFPKGFTVVLKYPKVTWVFQYV